MIGVQFRFLLIFKGFMPNQIKKNKSLAEQISLLEAGFPPSDDAGLFGMSIDPMEAKLVIIPVPWDATTSYGGGTSQAPLQIIPASHQLDLEDLGFGTPYKAGISLLPIPEEISQLSQSMRSKAVKLRELRQNGTSSDLPETEKLAHDINQASELVNNYVVTQAEDWLKKGKKIAVLGGDHSSPFGLINVLSKGDDIGVLHVDAHFDLRKHYEGFNHSHASIMFNVMENCPRVKHLSQIGIRDFSRDEHHYQKKLGERGSVLFSRDIGFRKAIGTTWAQLVEEALRPLPQKVYISFDIDGLDPSLCPSTGTPVPGGLSYEEAMFLIESVVRSGREVIGFDLCEVTPNEQSEWDANVGARVLYKLCGSVLHNL